jgi:hypothetical protein
MLVQRGCCGLIQASLTGYRISEKILFSLEAVYDCRSCKSQSGGGHRPPLNENYFLTSYGSFAVALIH